jgi:hypothetical protein
MYDDDHRSYTDCCSTYAYIFKLAPANVSLSHFLTSVDHHNQSMNLNPTDVYHFIFYGSTITGGTFNMNIYFGHPENTTDSSVKRSKTK